MLLRTKIVLSATAAIFVVAAVLICGQYLVLLEEQGRFARTSIQHEANAWSKIESAQLYRLKSSLKGVTRNRDALAALRSNDREAVFDSIVGTFNRLSSSKTIDHLVVTTVDGTSVVALPAGTTLDKDNAIAKAAGKSGKIVTGAVRRQDGGLAFAVATPLYSGRRAIGAVILMKDIVEVASELTSADGANALMFTKDGQVSFASDAALGLFIKPKLAKLTRTGLHYVDYRGRTLETIVLPVNDYSGASIAYVAVAQDVTDSLNRGRGCTRRSTSRSRWWFLS